MLLSMQAVFPPIVERRAEEAYSRSTAAIMLAHKNQQEAMDGTRPDAAPLTKQTTIIAGKRNSDGMHSNADEDAGGARRSSGLPLGVEHGSPGGGGGPGASMFASQAAAYDGFDAVDGTDSRCG